MAVLGGSLKRRERISARLGDVLSQLYTASAVLKRYDDEGRNEADLPLVHWGVQDALHRAEQAIDDLLDNFPNRLVAGVMRWSSSRPAVIIMRHRIGWTTGRQNSAGAQRHALPHRPRSVSDAERA